VTVGSGTPDIAAIDRYVESEMSAQRIPGLALGIVHHGRIVHLQGFGEADSSGRSVTPQTPFFIGSVTKSFTAMAVMQLSEAGQVDLDAPVQRFLPWWRVADANASAQVTVRDLLHQVSGLSKATGNAYATSGGTQDTALEERVRSLRSAVLTEPVGTTWQYSNANYWTLGMIVQAVSGESYESYIQKHIFEPLKMDNSFSSKAEAEAHGLPDGHRYWYGFPLAADLPFDRGGLPAGGLASSAEDMTHYLIAYLNGGRYGTSQLISSASATELQRPAVQTGQDDVGYAMGWEVTQRHGITTVSHDGSIFNAHANVVLLPDRGWGVVVMENAENSPDEFFGSRRMTGIAFGITDMLTGRTPSATSTATSLWAVYGVVLAIIILQAIGVARSLRTFRRWRTMPGRTPTASIRFWLRIALPVLANWMWAFTVLVLLPRKIGAPLSALLMGLPDLAYPLIGSAVFALAWSPVRAGLAIHATRTHPSLTSPVTREPVATA
jgi:CubicO group peptidase (beta-lactamase class C family)